MPTEINPLAFIGQSNVAPQPNKALNDLLVNNSLQKLRGTQASELSAQNALQTNLENRILAKEAQEAASALAKANQAKQDSINRTNRQNTLAGLGLTLNDPNNPAKLNSQRLAELGKTRSETLLNNVNAGVKFPTRIFNSLPDVLGSEFGVGPTPRENAARLEFTNTSGTDVKRETFKTPSGETLNTATKETVTKKNQQKTKDKGAKKGDNRSEFEKATGAKESKFDNLVAAKVIIIGTHPVTGEKGAWMEDDNGKLIKVTREEIDK